MQTRVVMIIFLIGILSVLMSMANGSPMPNPEVDTPSMLKIPQWHCLRYFKHDVHLMRRCRNQRILNARPREGI